MVIGLHPSFESIDNECQWRWYLNEGAEKGSERFGTPKLPVCTLIPLRGRVSGDALCSRPNCRAWLVCIHFLCPNCRAVSDDRQSKDLVQSLHVQGYLLYYL